MFNKAAEFKTFRTARPAAGVKLPANDNGRDIVRPARRPRLVCRWSLSQMTGRPVCRWEADRADEPVGGGRGGAG